MEPERIDRYRLDRLLDQGQAASTYQAWDERLHRPVLLRRLCPSPETDLAERERFLHEARMLGRLRHPHIVAIHDVGLIEECPFLVAEWLPGPTLQDALVDGPLPPQEALQIVCDLTDALEGALREGVTTLLLHPTAVRFTANRQVKLLDQVGKRPGTAEGTEEGALTQLGHLLYYLLTGQPPATPDPTPPQVVNPALPAGLAHLVLELLDPGARDRFPSLADVAQALADYRDPQPFSLPPHPTVPTPPTLPARQKGLPITPLLIAGALLVILFLTWRGTSTQSRTAASLSRPFLALPTAGTATVALAGGKAEPPPLGEQDRLYPIRLREPSLLVARLYRLAAGLDYDLYLYDAGGQELGRSTQTGSAEERIELSLPAGEYRLRVHYLVGPPGAAHQVRWHWTPLAP